MTKHLFWFVEFRNVAMLLNKGMKMDEIKIINEAENLFNVKTAYRKKVIFNAIAARINAIPKDFIEFFGNTDIYTQKFIAVIAVMAVESLFFDFMYEVYSEKLKMGDNTVTIGDFTLFFRNKQVINERIAAWTDTTFNRLGRAYRNVLVKSGLLKNLKKNEWSVVKPVINRQLTDVLYRTKMEIFYSALTGETL